MSQKRNSNLSTLAAKLLATDGTKKSVEKFVSEMKKEGKNLQQFLEQLYQDTPEKISAVLQKLCEITGQPLRTIVPEKLRNKLTNSERNSFRSVANFDQQFIWKSCTQSQPNQQQVPSGGLISKKVLPRKPMATQQTG